MNYISLTILRLGTFWRKCSGIKEEGLKPLWRNSSFGWWGGGWGEKETVDEHAVLFVQYEVGFLFLKKSKMFQMMWLELLVIAFHSE